MVLYGTSARADSITVCRRLSRRLVVRLPDNLLNRGVHEPGVSEFRRQIERFHCGAPRGTHTADERSSSL